MAKQITQQQLQALCKRYDKKIAKLGHKDCHTQMSVIYAENIVRYDIFVWDKPKENFLAHTSMNSSLTQAKQNLWKDYEYRLKQES